MRATQRNGRRGPVHPELRAAVLGYEAGMYTSPLRMAVASDLLPAHCSFETTFSHRPLRRMQLLSRLQMSLQS